jgi:NAD(P)-dependent dehydrogenase (short-subunit alcohol dehydrogenase family)
MSSRQKSALVTGCSSGIGLATALDLHRAGYRVYATVRRRESLADLQHKGDRVWNDPSKRDRWQPLLLDVSSAEDVVSVVQQIADEEVPLRVLVNNAGYGQFGALEDLTEEEFRRQWEVNVAGLWRVTRKALPLLRASGPGASIVNVSSVLGRFALPFGGAYAASKFAVEALSDSLRNEVASWGIRVIVIEPGPIATRFSRNAMDALDFNRAAQSPYAEIYTRLQTYYTRKTRWGETSARDVSRIILRAVHARRPRTRYVITLPGRLGVLASTLLPDRIIDRILRRHMGLD